jgi:hypothetical protein
LNEQARKKVKESGTNQAPEKDPFRISARRAFIE